MPDKKINLEQQMIRHCAYVLAGMKIANLFRYQAETEIDWRRNSRNRR